MFIIEAWKPSNPNGIGPGVISPEWKSGE